MLVGQTLTLKKPLSLDKQMQIEESLGQKTKNPQPSVKETLPVADSSAHQQRLGRRKEAVDWFMQAFPQCFNPKAPLPLKIGIGKGILEQWVYLSSLPYDRKIPSRMDVRKALGWYVTRLRYYQAFETASHRVGLDGKEAGEITEAEKEYARLKIREIKERHKAKKVTNEKL